MNLVLSSGVLPNRFKTENPRNVWRVTPLIWGRVQEFLKRNGVGAVLRYNFLTPLAWVVSAAGASFSENRGQASQ